MSHFQKKTKQMQTRARWQRHTDPLIQQAWLPCLLGNATFSCCLIMSKNLFEIELTLCQKNMKINAHL